MVSLDFLITSLIVVLIPGTGVVLTISTGLAHGRSASIYAALGCTLGILPHLLATALGLAAVMHNSALLFQTVKFAGVLYLFYLAYATWRDRSELALSAETTRATGLSIVSKAILLNTLNPKLTLFFLAFLPQFVTPGSDSSLAQLFVLSGIFMAMTFGIFVVYGLLANTFRKRVIESHRVQIWLRRVFAGAFAGLGAQLAFSDR